MPSKLLTQVALDALKADRQIDFWDSRTPGFGIRVGPRSKTFIIKVRNRRITLGTYPAISLQEARRRALGIKADTSSFGRSISFTEARTAFLAAKQLALRPRSYREINRTVTLHFRWTKALDLITHNDVATAIEAIEAPSEANHAFKDIRTFFNWCVPRYLKYSPCTGLKPPHKSNARARILSDNELKSIWRACEYCCAVGESPVQLTARGESNAPKLKSRTTLPESFARIVQFLILSGLRRGECAHIQSDHVKNNLLTLPPALTKNGKEHVLPLCSKAQNLLANALKTLSSETSFVFPGRSSKTCFNGWSKAKTQLDKASGVTDWTIHDLRRTVATRMAEMGVSPHVIERILNHVSGQISGVAAVYNRARYVLEMRHALELWETRLATITNGA